MNFNPASRFSLKAITGFILHNFSAKQRRRAAQDPGWKSIEARRRADNSGSWTFLSDDLTIADYYTQSEIEENLTPTPRYIGLVRKLHNSELIRVKYVIKSAISRVVKGYDAKDVFNLNSALCITLSKRLTELANITNGWPGEGSAWSSFEQWKSELLFNAQELLRFNGSTKQSQALELWGELAKDNSLEIESEAALDAHLQIEREDIQAAKNALAWVAHNLEYLWD